MRRGDGSVKRTPCLFTIFPSQSSHFLSSSYSSSSSSSSSEQGRSTETIVLRIFNLPESHTELYSTQLFTFPNQEDTDRHSDPHVCIHRGDRERKILFEGHRA